MTTLTAVFQTLLNLSLTALPVMAAVLLARLCLRRAPKKYSYALWAVVGFRLLCSVSLPSPMSLFNSAPVQTTQESARIAVQQWGKMASGNSYAPPAAEGVAGIVGGNAAGSAPVGNLSLGAPSGLSAMEILAVLWAVGLAAMLIWAVVSYLRVRRSVRQGVRLEDGVFQCDGLKTPFVLGCFRPKIYVPFRMSPRIRMVLPGFAPRIVARMPVSRPQGRQEIPNLSSSALTRLLVSYSFPLISGCA